MQYYLNNYNNIDEYPLKINFYENNFIFHDE